MDVEHDSCIIRCAAAMSLIARKGAKIQAFTEAVNSTGRATRLAPGMLDLPSVTLLALPATGPLQELSAVRVVPFFEYQIADKSSSPFWNI